MIRNELIYRLAFELKQLAADIDRYQKLKDEAETPVIGYFYEDQIKAVRNQKWGFMFALNTLGIKEQVVNAALDLENKK